MQYDFLASPNVYAISCELTDTQLIAEMLYLKVEFPEPKTINLYSDDRVLVATVELPKTSNNTHRNIALTLC